MPHTARQHPRQTPKRATQTITPTRTRGRARTPARHRQMSNRQPASRHLSRPCAAKIRPEFPPRLTPCQSSSPQTKPLPNHPILWRDRAFRPRRLGSFTSEYARSRPSNGRYPSCRQCPRLSRNVSPLSGARPSTIPHQTGPLNRNLPPNATFCATSDATSHATSALHDPHGNAVVAAQNRCFPHATSMQHVACRCCTPVSAPARCQYGSLPPPRNIPRNMLRNIARDPNVARPSTSHQQLPLKTVLFPRNTRRNMLRSTPGKCDLSAGRHTTPGKPELLAPAVGACAVRIPLFPLFPPVQTSRFCLRTFPQAEETCTSWPPFSS